MLNTGFSVWPLCVQYLHLVNLRPACAAFFFLLLCFSLSPSLRNIHWKLTVRAMLILPDNSVGEENTLPVIEKMCVCVCVHTAPCICLCGFAYVRMCFHSVCKCILLQDQRGFIRAHLMQNYGASETFGGCQTHRALCRPLSEIC